MDLKHVEELKKEFSDINKIDKEALLTILTTYDDNKYIVSIDIIDVDEERVDLTVVSRVNTNLLSTEISKTYAIYFNIYLILKVKGFDYNDLIELVEINKVSKPILFQYLLKNPNISDDLKLWIEMQ